MRRVAIAQPGYFPWLGLIDRMHKADVFVILDSVDFDRTSYQHRVQIKGSRGAQWLTIPFVHKFPQKISAVQIADPHWAKRHKTTLITAYGKAPHFDYIWDWLGGWYGHLAEPIAVEAPPYSLSSITISSTLLLAEWFGQAEKIQSSAVMEMETGPFSGEKSDLVLEVLQRVGATHYLCGRGGSHYLNWQSFADAGIAVEIHEYQPVEYPQRFGGPFIPGLSALDYLFNTGLQTL